MPPLWKRRSHRKSRLGCFACKAHRTKCSERLPICEKCKWRGTRCVYPTDKKLAGSSGQSNPQVLQPRRLLAAPAVQTTLELRYFHHFLTVAYPFLPLGNEQVWQIQVPQLAMQNTFVMSAMLGLSAAHLARVTSPNEHQRWAVVYRGRALAGLNAALSNTDWARSTVDGTLALVFLLASQSQYMEDGLFDFITMIRGCVLMSKYFVQRGCDTSFHLEQTTTAPSVPEYAVGTMPSLDPCCIEKGLVALNLLAPMIQTEEQSSFFLAIQAIFEASQMSTLQGFEAFWNYLDNSKPISFISSDPVTKALQTFLITLRLFMDPITQHIFCPPEKPYNTQQEVRLVTISWCLQICRSMPCQMKKYVQWPEAMAQNALLENKPSTANNRTISAAYQLE